MSFEVFDTKKIDEYAAQAKASWGTTEAYKEYEQKSAGRTKESQQKLNVEMLNIFAEFGKIKEKSPDCEECGTLSILLRDLQSIFLFKVLKFCSEENWITCIT